MAEIEKGARGYYWPPRSKERRSAQVVKVNPDGTVDLIVAPRPADPKDDAFRRPKAVKVVDEGEKPAAGSFQVAPERKSKNTAVRDPRRATRALPDGSPLEQVDNKLAPRDERLDRMAARLDRHGAELDELRQRLAASEAKHDSSEVRHEDTAQRLDALEGADALSDAAQPGEALAPSREEDKEEKGDGKKKKKS